MLRKFIIVAAVVTLSATGAFAKSVPLQATLATAPKTRDTTAGSIIWRCDGTSCVSVSDASNTSDASACRSLVLSLGPVSAFTTSNGKAFDEAKLQKCNGTK